MSLDHITLNEADGKADCSICQVGVTVPPSFGGIPRADMLAAFVVCHAVHTKSGRANGLTSTGRATKAVREQLGIKS